MLFTCGGIPSPTGLISHLSSQKKLDILEYLEQFHSIFRKFQVSCVDTSGADLPGFLVSWETGIPKMTIFLGLSRKPRDCPGNLGIPFASLQGIRENGLKIR